MLHAYNHLKFAQLCKFAKQYVLLKSLIKLGPGGKKETWPRFDVFPFGDKSLPGLS